jgi:hypothetical protein
VYEAMIVEHSFVTILTPAQAFDVVEGFLGAYGFRRLGPPSPVWRDFVRGKKNAAAVAYLRDVPQKIRIEYDRGRILFAASIEFHRKEDPRVRDFTVGLAIGLDRLLEDQFDSSIAHAMVEGPSEAIDMRDKKHKFIRVSLVSLLITVLTLPVLVGIIASL